MLARLQSLISGPPFDPSSLRAAMSSGKLRDSYVTVALLTTLLSAASAAPEIATFAAGCFWGVEHIFLKYYPPSQNKGLLKTAVGYTGGKESSTNPGYREVCSGVTDHAEALRIEFDPKIVSYAELVGKLCFYVLVSLINQRH